MVGCKWYQFGNRPTSGRDSLDRPRKWHWGSGTSSTERSKKFRLLQSKREVALDVALRVARRAIIAGRGECKNSAELRKQALRLSRPKRAAKVGDLVMYIPVGSFNGSLKHGTVVKIPVPGSANQVKSAFVIIKRCRKERGADNRLASFVAVSSQKRFCAEVVCVALLLCCQHAGLFMSQKND